MKKLIIIALFFYFGLSNINNASAQGCTSCGTCKYALVQSCCSYSVYPTCNSTWFCAHDFVTKSCTKTAPDCASADPGFWPGCTCGDNGGTCATWGGYPCVWQLGCCGNTTCEFGESCTSCPGDCGACPTATSVPAPTDTPTPTPTDIPPGVTVVPTNTPPPGSTPTPTPTNVPQPTATPTPPPCTPCTWCTNQGQCAASGMSWSSGGCCSVSGDGCCSPISGPTPTPGGCPTCQQCSNCCNPYGDPTCGEAGRPNSLSWWDDNCRERFGNDSICCVAPGNSASCRREAPAEVSGYVVLSTGGSLGQSTTTDNNHCTNAGADTCMGGSADCQVIGSLEPGYSCGPVFAGVNVAEGGTNYPSWWCQSRIKLWGHCSYNAEGQESWWWWRTPVNTNNLNFTFSNLTVGSRVFQITGVPAGYTCSYTFIIGGVNTSGSGCFFVSPALQGNNFLIVVLVPEPTPTPTPTPLPCASNFNVSCDPSGSQATISWNALVGAVKYILRLNHEPYDAPINWLNAAQGDQWFEPVSSSVIPNITPSANYQYDIQGVKPGEIYPYSGARCPLDIFKCIPNPSKPTLSCGVFNRNPASPSTPLTITWANGTGIQVWDNTGRWWYNAWKTSPLTIDVLPGRIYYAQTTYDFDIFSAVGSTVGDTNCDLPPNPSPAIISGKLQQKSGDGCYVTSTGNTINVSSFTITTSSSCVSSPGCTTALDGNYTCTVNFDSNACLDLPTPSWPTSVDVTWNNVFAQGYTTLGWTISPSCSNELKTLLSVPAEATTSRAFTFDFDGTNWYKLKDSSFANSNTSQITVPAIIHKYESSDTDDDATKKYFIIGEGGNIIGTTVNPDPPGTAYSIHNWETPSYTDSLSFTPTKLLSYVQARKTYTEITALSEINADGTYVYTGTDNPLTITSANVPDHNFVLISLSQPITIGGTNFNPTTSMAIVANSLTFSDTIEEATGIFIANTIDIGTTTNQGLKINGNLIAQTGFTNNRQWSDTSKPTLFVVFKPNIYLDLLPYLSTSVYDWRLVQ